MTDVPTAPIVPLLTRDLPGTGGVVKRAPEDFVVEEVPLYEPAGEGEHVYVRHRRTGRTTRELVLAFARAFGVDPRDVGYAGQKDKRAVATQTFSLTIPRVDPAEVARRIEAEVGGEVLGARRHVNKLRRGHLIGNRFTLRVADVHPDALPRARAIAAELVSRGLPNAFGPQRYGDDGANAARGRALLDKPRRGWLAELHLCAWQSSLFDRWLARRMESGHFECVVPGDVAKKVANGALFDVVDVAAENERFARGEITHTGPLFGASMRAASGEELALEESMLAAENVTLPQLARARLEGTRRAGRVPVLGLEVGADGADLVFTFQLPKGSYATTVLREFTKDAAAVDDADD